jgi:glycyl-tRNA synthetase
MNLQSIYNNGLIVWNSRQIRLRNQITEDIADRLEEKIRTLNPAWVFHRIEAPTLIPQSKINPEYNTEDYFITQITAKPDDFLCLAPETTQSSYDYAQFLIKENAAKLPLCIWQLRKSYRNEQDKTIKHLRFKEFYQLEFQFIYSNNSKADYVNHLTNAIAEIISSWIPEIEIAPSDRIPSYSINTNDIIAFKQYEIASLSQRTDSPILNSSNFEIAIGIDRIISLITNQF